MTETYSFLLKIKFTGAHVAYLARGLIFSGLWIQFLPALNKKFNILKWNQNETEKFILVDSGSFLSAKSKVCPGKDNL